MRTPRYQEEDGGMEEEVGRSLERHAPGLLFASADGHLVDDLQGFGAVTPAGGRAVTVVLRCKKSTRITS